MKANPVLQRLAHSRWYWILLMSAGITMLAIALGYQYVLGEQPCVLCIHVRLWVSLLVIFAALGLWLHKSAAFNSIIHFFTLLIAAGLAERSYQLFGVEHRFIFGDCTFDLGLPTWFAIDQWLPALYEAKTSCGYTPVLFSDITMAEALIVISALFVVVSLAMFLASLKKQD